LGGKEILWEKGILEIVKGFLNERLWKHCSYVSLAACQLQQQGKRKQGKST
jgi:hypothetical protein